MTSPDIRLSDCKVHIAVEPHHEYPHIQKSLILTLSHPTHGSIASLAALHINRDASRLGGRFLQIMDEDQQELADFSQALFDKFGFLKKHLIQNPHLRGTAAWGREMNSGGLIYIFIITVNEQFRGRGLGSWILWKLVNSEHVEDHDFLVCWPIPLSRDIDVQGPERLQLGTRIQESQIHFFRKNHFRRIGRTPFFAFSPNINHPSRSIPVDADAPALSSIWSGSGNIDTESQSLQGLPSWQAQRMDIELRHSRYPLHSAIHDTRGESIAQDIQTAYNADPDAIHKQDDQGFTPVFAAASTKNIHALRKLIQLGVSEDLTSRDNADGLTPLEACTRSMVSTREFSETLLQKWDGFSREELLCVAAMKRVISPSRMIVTDEEYVARRKWGCTCGMCLEGWLSPRMKLRLEYDGEIKYDIMADAEDSIGFVNGKPLSAGDLDMAPGIDFIPSYLRHQINETFYHGYRCAFEAFTSVSRKSVIPYPIAVRKAMVAGGFRGHDYFASRAVSFYFSEGGLPDYAIDCILHSSEEQSPLGNSEFDATFEDDLRNLPECANDFEFSLVRQNLGLESRGPYRDEEQEMYDDSDQDND